MLLLRNAVATGLEVGFRQFLKLGALVMPPALVLAIGGLLLTG